MSDTKRPVRISAEAHKEYATHARKWAGHRDTALTFGAPDPKISPWAMTDLKMRAMTVNADALLLNPNRVLKQVTPFRLRQEAVLTGAIMHEAAHIRFSKWMPKDEDELKALRHSDGGEVAVPTLMLARLAEEVRIEGLMVEHVDATGLNLGWTLRASAAHLLPVTVLDVHDAEKQTMQLIQSWILRAGRQHAIRQYAKPGTFPLKQWVNDFDQTLAQALGTHTLVVAKDSVRGRKAFEILRKMVQWDGTDPSLSRALKQNTDGFVDEDELDIEREVAHPDHAGPFLLDMAKEVLDLLFPDTGAEGAPEARGCCGTAGGEPGQTGGENAEQGDSGDEDQPAPAEPGDGESEGGPVWGETLKDLEAQASDAAKRETQDSTKTESMMSGGNAGGWGGSKPGQFGVPRPPTTEERGLAKEAERFLRDMINPNESSKVLLSESPSATVDPAALAAWRAGGMSRSPLFFKRTKRTVEPSPPVKIAILVDVSGSMDVMQEPSAVLSWTLASAALDLRNFAGRGRQVESTLIHWGDYAQVIQKNGETLPGITKHRCDQGTSAMHAALILVDEQMPGFFEVPEDGTPSNRLVVQFTDWQLSSRCVVPTMRYIEKMMTNGVNMLSVVPAAWSTHQLSSMVRGVKNPRGRSEVLPYEGKKSNVWDRAAQVLRG